jgi:hypothetical protein
MAKYKNKGVGRPPIGEDEANKQLNLQLRTAERMGLRDQPAYTPVGGWPNRFEVIPAPTSEKTGPDKRPRALECAYDHKTETLFIAFRQKTRKVPNSNTVVAVGLPPIIEYRDVPVDMWEDLKMSDSTGKYLKYSGLDGVATKADEVQMSDLKERFGN